MKKKELQKRIAELQEKLNDKYIPTDIKEAIEGDLEFLLKLRHALYGY